MDIAFAKYPLLVDDLHARGDNNLDNLCSSELRFVEQGLYCIPYCVFRSEHALLGFYTFALLETLIGQDLISSTNGST